MSEYLYTQDHQWVLRKGNRVRVGISEFAQEELGEIAFVELPALNREVVQGEPVCSLDSLKSSSELYAPVSGRIVQTNDLLDEEKNCHLVNSDPLGKGWIFTIEMTRPQELEGLLSADAYRELVQERGREDG